ncbi:MAG: sugar phosphate isomerase/epimerase family protein [Fimbriimonadaceae bacterium]
MLRISAWLGLRTLLTIPGIVYSFFDASRPTLDYDGVERRAEEGLRKLVPLAEELGVRMAIENVWNKFLLSPTERRAFVDRFESAHVGAYVDVANVLPYGHPDQWLRILGPRVMGIHFKDFRKSVGTEHGFVGLLEGDVDWPSVMSAIREIGYDGPVVAEMIPNYAHYGKVKIGNASRAMDAILAGGEERTG